MVFIARDGSVHNQQPWSLERVIGLFWAFINFIKMFFMSMFDNVGNNNGSNTRGDLRRNWGGGGGGGPGGRGPPRPPNRRLGRVNTLADCNIPGGG